MQSNKVVICGVDTSKLPKLNAKQMMELFERVQAGDKQAREEFVFSNLRLVLSIIQRFSGRVEQADDLFQVGCIGLIKAMDNFDTGHGVKFSTYAVPMIIGEIRRYLRDNNSIRVARSLRDTAYKALQVRSMLASQNMHDPSPEEIAQVMEVNTQAVVYALDAIADPVSLFEPIYNDGGDAIFVMDQIGDEKENEDNWSDVIAIKEGIKKLAEREQTILKLRFFEGKTQMEVAEEIGISQAQVSRLEKNALKTMKKYV